MIDLHAHVLPGIDDGPATVDDAMDLVWAFVEAGATTVVATPHINDAHANTSRTIEASLDVLRTALRREQAPLEVITGAEIDMLHVQRLPPEELARLGLGGSRYLLVECPFTPVAAGFEAMLSRLAGLGHGVVLAHPERSPTFLRDRRLLRRLVDRGALASVTAASLTGGFGKDSQRYALAALAEGLAHNVASDAHDALRRHPGISAPLERAGLAWMAEWLTAEVPAAIIAGEPPPPPPTAPAARGMRRWARGRRL